MVCIYCGSTTQVINSRAQKRLNQVWRRRQCVTCSNILTTHELIDLASGLTVKSDGVKENLTPFNRDRLFVSIYESCKHRASAADDAAALTQTVIAQLRQIGQKGTIARDTVAAATHEVLMRFDVAAATMYAAYHPYKSAPQSDN